MATETKSNFEQLIDEIFSTIKSVGDKLHARLQKLEASDVETRLKALEQRPAPMNYRGVFREADGPYLKNEIVTHGGSAWICKEMTSARPGGPNHESRAWTLMVKRGDDAPKDPPR